MRRVPAFDIPLFMCILILVGLGIAFIYSASYPRAMNFTDTGGNDFFYAGRQMLFAGAGLVGMTACMFISLAKLRRISLVITIVTILMLIAVLLVGNDAHGNRASINIGFIQFQPSEFTKVAIVLSLAAFLIKRPLSVKSWKGLASGPLWFVLVPVILIALERDLGMMFVVSFSTVLFLLAAGTPSRFVFIPLLGLLLIGSLVVVSGHCPDRVEARVKALLNPEDTANPASFHPRNALIAVGSGGLFGQGFCQSRQKWFYLPAPHNDYIMAVAAEELGFLWLTLLLFAPYILLIYRGFTIAHRAPDAFSALLAIGCTIMLSTPAFINMAVVMNVLPSMGINLPFISYGGSSIIASMMLAGLLLNVSAQRAPVNRPVQGT